MSKIKLNYLNTIVGLGWNDMDLTHVVISTHGYSMGEVYLGVKVGKWEFTCWAKSEDAIDVELWLKDLRDFLKVISKHYQNPNALIEFEADGDGLRFIGGPGNGITLKSIGR